MARNQSQVELITAKAAAIRRFVEEHPDCPLEEMLSSLKISENSLYTYLLGFIDDPAVCCEQQEFKVLRDGLRLQAAEVQQMLASMKGKKRGPEPAERLIYLYSMLQNTLPDGGLTFSRIKYYYLELMSHHSAELPSDEAIRRMIYRDIKDLEDMGIAIQRPATGSSHYCLMESYLPKLPVESAATVYISMLLYRGTLLEGATQAAKREIERAFFKTIPNLSERLQERVYVLGDTLTNPRNFGDILGKIILAVAESYRLDIDYVNAAGVKSRRFLEPLGIVCKRSVWYLIAHDLRFREYRTFRVDQIQSPYLRSIESFEYPEDFSLSDHIGYSWGVFANDPVQTVRLKFSPAVALRVKNICYHPSQKISEELADGSLILEYQICGLIELHSWILQWGTQVEVLQPKALRRQVKKSAREIYEKYK